MNSISKIRNAPQPKADEDYPPKKEAPSLPFIKKAEIKEPWKFIEDKSHDLLENIKNKTEVIFEEILSPWRNKPKPKEIAKISSKFETPKLCVGEINESQEVTEEKKQQQIINELESKIKDLNQNLIQIVKKQRVFECDNN